MQTTFTIDLERLRQWHANEYRGAAGAYMEGRGEQDVLEAVADYLALVNEFDTRFGDAYVRNRLEKIEASWERGTPRAKRCGGSVSSSRRMCNCAGRQFLHPTGV